MTPKTSSETPLTKSINVIGTLVFVIGLVILFLPHAFHESVGLGEEHEYHLLEGGILYILGLGTLIVNNRALKGMKGKTKKKT